MFQKSKHGHNSWKYCLALPAYLKDSALPTKASSAKYIPELHAMLLMMKKKKKKLVLWWNTRTNENFWFIMRITETLEILGSFRCVTFSILPQKFRIVLEDNEVICSQRTILMGRTFDEVLWWPLQYFPLSWCSDVGLAIGMAAQYSLGWENAECLHW